MIRQCTMFWILFRIGIWVSLRSVTGVWCVWGRNSDVLASGALPGRTCVSPEHRRLLLREAHVLALLEAERGQLEAAHGLAVQRHDREPHGRAEAPHDVEAPDAHGHRQPGPDLAGSRVPIILEDPPVQFPVALGNRGTAIDRPTACHYTESPDPPF